MTKYNVNDACLNGPSSKITLDVLLKNGAIKLNDLLCVRYEPDDGTSNTEVAVVGPPSRDPQNPHHYRLDIKVLTHQAGTDGILRDLKGPTDIINRMDGECQDPNGRWKNLSEPWKMVGVVREDGSSVGNMWKVRQAYEVFTTAMTEWGERNNEMSE